MAIKHNQQLPNNHFHKDWQRRVRVHFDQPGRKSRRRATRLAKAAAVAPRPVDKLRPVVRCPTIKYNRRARAGRGFTLTELKEAGIPRKLAPTIGIAVDARRLDTNQETLSLNVSRLKAYKARLILFPRKSGQHKKLDSSEADVKMATESAEKKDGKLATTVQGVMAIDAGVGIKHGFQEIKKGDMPAGEEAAYRKLRNARSEARFVGVRAKRAKAKEEAEEAKKK
ncbi:50S ribosomal protein L13e [Cladophialophora psammophila CBS 110553]|uniref:60S ribosomal protein L13 n=1 Tax=Cladophialophora psammophila CBS 110553 TaxID=1182543 RepID=W9XHC6_9EURO|nr:50S ribosomal protein L13e [Cladophialophora psammophila CBS 110553]EXJ76755.1 50S ribosomal protein L13e [Cladophialophora psammophila CBS 110553]